jgi:hypothetical protein
MVSPKHSPTRSIGPDCSVPVISPSFGQAL